jgi:hypothetical protein
VRPFGENLTLVLYYGASGTRAGGNYLWAELMQRTFPVDVLACPRCGDQPTLIPLIEERLRRGAAHQANELLWDAMGVGDGVRRPHALYERKYFGNYDNIRTEVVWAAEHMGKAEQYKGLPSGA